MTSRRAGVELWLFACVGGRGFRESGDGGSPPLLVFGLFKGFS